MPPLKRVTALLSRVTPLTGTNGAITFTTQLRLIPFAVARIVVTAELYPAVTTPADVTEAIELLSLLHTGVTEGDVSNPNEKFSPYLSVIFVVFKLKIFSKTVR